MRSRPSSAFASDARIGAACFAGGEGVVEESKKVQRVRVFGVRSIPCGRSQRLKQIWRQRCANVHLATGYRMPEAQPGSVKEVSPGRKTQQPAPSAASIRVIADHRVTDRGGVHADLVGAPRTQGRTYEVNGIKARQSHQGGVGRAARTDGCRPPPV